MGPQVVIENLVNHRTAIPIIARCHFKEWGSLTGRATLLEYVAHLEGVGRGPALPLVFVALAEGQLVGSASLVACDVSIRHPLTPSLAQLFVPSAQRHRLGARS